MEFNEKLTKGCLKFLWKNFGSCTDFNYNDDCEKVKEAIERWFSGISEEAVAFLLLVYHMNPQESTDISHIKYPRMKGGHTLDSPDYMVAINDMSFMRHGIHAMGRFGSFWIADQEHQIDDFALFDRIKDAFLSAETEEEFLNEYHEQITGEPCPYGEGDFDDGYFTSSISYEYYMTTYFIDDTFRILSKRSGVMDMEVGGANNDTWFTERYDSIVKQEWQYEHWIEKLGYERS